MNRLQNVDSSSGSSFLFFAVDGQFGSKTRTAFHTKAHRRPNA